MPVPSRIKIIRVNDLEEVENKVNDFLTRDKKIAQLANIDYRLESNFVIIEYFVMDDKLQQQLEQNNRDVQELKEISASLRRGNINNNDDNNPFTYWLKLCFLSSRTIR